MRKACHHHRFEHAKPARHVAEHANADCGRIDCQKTRPADARMRQKHVKGSGCGGDIKGGDQKLARGGAAVGQREDDAEKRHRAPAAPEEEDQAHDSEKAERKHSQREGFDAEDPGDAWRNRKGCKRTHRCQAKPEGERHEGDHPGDFPRLKPEARIGAEADRTGTQRSKSHRVSHRIGREGGNRHGAGRHALADIIERIGIVENQRGKAQRRRENGKRDCTWRGSGQRCDHIIIAHLFGEPVDRYPDQGKEEDDDGGNQIEPVALNEPLQRLEIGGRRFLVRGEHERSSYRQVLRRRISANRRG